LRIKAIGRCALPLKLLEGLPPEYGPPPERHASDKP